MTSEYCISCGTKALFEVSRPSFCPGCGNPFNQTKASAQKFAETLSKPEEEVNGQLPHITRANMAIEVDLDTMKPMTLKEHILNAPEKVEKYERPSSPHPKGEAALESVLSDCAPTRATKDIDEQ